MVILCKSFLVSIWRLSENSGNPNQVMKTMKRVMEQTSKLQHAIYTLDLHVQLKKNRLGTSNINNVFSLYILATKMYS